MVSSLLVYWGRHPGDTRRPLCHSGPRPGPAPSCSGSGKASVRCHSNGWAGPVASVPQGWFCTSCFLAQMNKQSQSIRRYCESEWVSEWVSVSNDLVHLLRRTKSFMVLCPWNVLFTHEHKDVNIIETLFTSFNHANSLTCRKEKGDDK